MRTPDETHLHYRSVLSPIPVENSDEADYLRMLLRKGHSQIEDNELGRSFLTVMKNLWSLGAASRITLDMLPVRIVGGLEIFLSSKKGEWKECSTVIKHLLTVYYKRVMKLPISFDSRLTENQLSNMNAICRSLAPFLYGVSIYCGNQVKDELNSLIDVMESPSRIEFKLTIDWGETVEVQGFGGNVKSH